MGVPKFYRWLSERFPCLSEVVKEHQIPEFDNLYLDMNGIVHNCSHPNDDDPHFRITEEKIFQDIFHYIEVLFRMIQPKKVFFMAIDGVAPRAKMNQQRGRRFRSAKDAETNEKRARDRGEKLPEEARFDSNCITPGTPFMYRLHQQLKYFVSSKLSADSLWQGVKVVLSGHETPGEGEHKIMDFIRYEKSRPGYDPNVRHCLYGLDADLMMLGLCTHDPHFSLLREEVRFGGKKQQQKRIVTPEETTFHLLHLSLLREYIDHEFGALRKRLQAFEYDPERVIDDWVLLGFLVGNDFLPNLPHLHINKGALSELYDTYKRVLPSLGGYLHDGGALHLERLEKFLAALAEDEMDRFDDIYSDSKWLEGKTAAKRKDKRGKHRRAVKATPGPAHVDSILMGTATTGNAFETLCEEDAPNDPELRRLLRSTEEFEEEDEDDGEVVEEEEDGDGDDDDSDNYNDDGGGRGKVYHMEFRQHKREYYISKMNYEKVTSEVLEEQAEGYVRALQWNLHYYYNGCASWSWYYPHHFAPYITDIKGFAGMDIRFDLGEPFLPFEQLLSVLPAASKELLPPALQGLMVSPLSPIIDFFPQEFECDMNGKQQEWEAVVLIPFIDEKRLLEAATPLYGRMTAEEKSRNVHGPMSLFTHSQTAVGRHPAPAYFPAVEVNHAAEAKVWRSEWDVPVDRLRKGLMDAVKLDVFFPGFPTLKHIPHAARLKAESVRVFEQPSRGENMMLVLEGQGRPDIEEVAEQLLGQEIWVSWPHMVEAKVVAVFDSRTRISCGVGSGGQRKQDGMDPEEFRARGKGIADRYKSRWGVIVGLTHIVVEACTMTGRKYVCGHKGRITLEKQWSKSPQPYALQTTRKDILVHDPSFAQWRTLPELFPTGSACFMLSRGMAEYGCQGTVLQVSKEHRGRVQLAFVEPKEVDLGAVFRGAQHDEVGSRYLPGYRAAQKLGMSSHLLSRITGSVFVQRGPKEAAAEHAGRVNVGLNLKFNKRNEEVCGYTRKSADGWTYSQKTVELIAAYAERFPRLFRHLSGGSNVQNDVFHHLDVFPDGDGEEALKELGEWMREQPCASAERQPCGTMALDREVVLAVERAVEGQRSDRKKEIKMQVKPHLLYKPNLSQGASLPDPETTFRLFDRVVNVREGFSVPLGLRGTITGINAAAAAQGASQQDAMLEVLFDSEFSGGLSIRSSPSRSYRVPGSALINLTHGRRCASRPASEAQAPPTAALPQRKPTAIVPPLDGAPNVWTNRHNNKKVVASFAGTPKSPVVVRPPDPKNLPRPNFGGKKVAAQDEANFRRIWRDMEAASSSSNQGDDLAAMLEAMDVTKPAAAVAASAASAPGPNIAPSVKSFFAAATTTTTTTTTTAAAADKRPSGQVPTTSSTTAFVPLQVSVKSAQRRRCEPNEAVFEDEEEAAKRSTTSAKQRGNRGGRRRQSNGAQPSETPEAKPGHNKQQQQHPERAHQQRQPQRPQRHQEQEQHPQQQASLHQDDVPTKQEQQHRPPRHQQQQEPGRRRRLAANFGKP